MENRTQDFSKFKTDSADIVRPGDLTDPYPDTLSAAERSTAVEAYSLYSVKTDVPREYLWGRQHPRDFTRSPEYRIKSLYHQLGRDLLVKKPVWAVLTPTPVQDQSLIIVDGHKRTRYSSLFGINSIPTDVIDLEHLAEAWSQTTEDLGAELINQSAKAISRFEEIAQGKGKQIPRPQSIPAGLKAANLQAYFDSQKIQPELTQTQAQMIPIPIFVLHDRR